MISTYDTPPVTLDCAGCGHPALQQCARPHYCSERMQAAFTLDVEIAVRLFPAGIQQCQALAGSAVGRGRGKATRCNEMIPWFSKTCPRCGALALTTIPEPVSRRLVTALIKEIVGPTGLPLGGGVLHHLGTWGFHAVRLYLHERIGAPACVARSAARRLGMPKQANVLFDVLDQALDEMERALRADKRPLKVKPDNASARITPDPEDVAFYRQVFAQDASPSPFDVVHTLPCTAVGSHVDPF